MGYAQIRSRSRVTTEQALKRTSAVLRISAPCFRPRQTWPFQATGPLDWFPEAGMGVSGLTALHVPLLPSSHPDPSSVPGWPPTHCPLQGPWLPPGSFSPAPEARTHSPYSAGSGTSLVHLLPLPTLELILVSWNWVHHRSWGRAGSSILKWTHISRTHISTGSISTITDRETEVQENKGTCPRLYGNPSHS